MRNYRLTKQAEADLIRIHQHGMRQFGEALADNYYYAFFKRFEQLAENPYLYPAIEHIRHGYRRSVCGVDSIYYRVLDDVVEIVCILGQQEIDEWL